MTSLTSRPAPRAWAMPRRAFLAAGAASLLLPATLRAQETAPKPNRGGHLVLGIDNASTSDRLDPAFYWEQYNYQAGGQIFDTLTDLGPDGLVIPALAESWEPRDGGRQWVFALRRGVTFHNGKTLTPEDVIYSLNHHRGETTESAGKGYLLSVTDILKTGPNEITFNLSGANADFPYLLSDIHYVITADGADFDKGIGTGPFQLENFDPGVVLLVRRYENHWNPDRGFVDSVETLAFNDQAARVAALLSGQLHYINNVSAQLARQLQGNGAVKLIEEPDSQLALFVGRYDTGPFANADVRNALKYAIKRDQVLESVFSGNGSVAHDNPLFPSNRYHSNDLPRHDYDPEKAAFHWKKSGIDGPVTLAVADGATFAGAVDAAQLYQASAQAAGIPFEIDRVPADGYWSDVWMKRDFVGSIWSARPTADALLSLVYQSNSTWNETYWKNPRFDQVLLAARGELDEDKRRQLYHDAQLLIVEDNSSIIPIYKASIAGASAKLGGYKVIPGQVGPRVAAAAWLEA